MEFRGTNLWLLIFAILVASIGLNVNSTAVIIGAMLISPLMGPIMGAGYGVAVGDFELLRRALSNLGRATVASLLASALYFFLSPLSQAHSELLARTTPTVWDVGIALFGGLAGIVGVTRREKSNVVPGVAIATALMPPLCTADYGVATGQPAFFLGAFYLFFINSVFIAAATVLMARLMHLPQVGHTAGRTRARAPGSTLRAIARRIRRARRRPAPPRKPAARAPDAGAPASSTASTWSSVVSCQAHGSSGSRTWVIPHREQISRRNDESSPPMYREDQPWLARTPVQPGMGHGTFGSRVIACS